MTTALCDSDPVGVSSVRNRLSTLSNKHAIICFLLLYRENLLLWSTSLEISGIKNPCN